jgi:hypothetical protein
MLYKFGKTGGKTPYFHTFVSRKALLVIVKDWMTNNE